MSPLTTRRERVKAVLGYGIFALLGLAFVAGCIADLGWLSLIPFGVGGLLILAIWLVGGW